MSNRDDGGASVGSFFTNVQVHTGDRAPADVREAVIMTLRASAVADGFVEDATLSAEDADRVIYIGPVTAGPWISVYDEATEDQDDVSRRSLAARLSQVVGAAVSVLVHDSDVLELRLWQRGTEVDVYNSAPDYFELADQISTGKEPLALPLDYERTPPIGTAALWAPVLASDATPEALLAAWTIHDLFAEDTLARLAPLFNWDLTGCQVGYDYLPGSDLDLGTFARLAFRSMAHSRDSLLAEGPPRLVQGGGQTSLYVPVGTPFDRIGATFRSAGGPGRGVQVVIWGPALDQGIVEIHAIQVRSRASQETPVEAPPIPLLDGQSADGVKLRYAVVQEVEIVQGLVEDAIRLDGPQSGLSRRRLVEMQYESWIGVFFEGVATAPGEGDLYLGISPLENPSGQTSWTFEVEISRN
jgi:hypothetical protein